MSSCSRVLVFPSPRGGQLWSSSFSWIWKPVRAVFGRPTMALHELRHFCATYLLELGLAPADVAVQLGHTDGGALVMSTYGHPSDRAARARITAAMDGYATGELRLFRGRGAS
jgi:integrase